MSQYSYGRIRWITLILLVVCALTSYAGFTAWREYQRFSDAPLITSGTAATIDFHSGAGLDDLINELSRVGARTGARWQWQLLLRQLKLSRKLKAGEYALDANSTPRSLAYALALGKVVQHRFTIIEGTRFSDLRVALASNRNLKATIGGLSDVEILARIGSPYKLAEGLFLPESYQFPKGYSDLELLKKAYWDLQRVLDQAWQNRAPELPLANPYEALILASIIEKETAKTSERAQIAGVFVRRLTRNMRLQTDPTVIYGLGSAYDGDIRSADLRTDTPYNTYTRAGLTPTPIALPGAASIRAALQPEPGDTLYFVADGTGGHTFSETLEQHNAAVASYLPGQRQ